MYKIGGSVWNLKHKWEEGEVKMKLGVELTVFSWMVISIQEKMVKNTHIVWINNANAKCCEG